MDAGEWAEAQSGEDGSPEGGRPPSLVVRETPSLLGGNTAKSEVSSSGVHLDPALTMEIQGASMAHYTYFHL